MALPLAHAIWAKVLSHCDEHSACMAACASRICLSALQDVVPGSRGRWLYEFLVARGAPSDLECAPAEASIGRELRAVWSRLTALPSPGCKIQKYLRWLDGEPPTCAEVVRTLIALALLGAATCFEPSPEHDTHLELTRRTRAVVHWMFGRAHGSSVDVRIPDERVPALDVQDLVRLIAWIVERPGQPVERLGDGSRLRQTMAEFHQIACRGGAEALVSLHFEQAAAAGQCDADYRRRDRVKGAFIQLLSIARCCDDDLEYWA